MIYDLFWGTKKPKIGAIYNTGGRFSNCSIIEALNLVENSGLQIKKKILSKQNW